MRMSCNGCRILRKGCSDDCALRPSLQWIKSSQSQANATVFLAKFYGRAGLFNLISAAPTHLRPAIFKSLLFEACGRIINPVYGSVGLMCSGDWPRCESAVQAVLGGAPLIPQLSGDDDSSNSTQHHRPITPLRGCDIRHLSKDGAAASLHRVRTRTRFKRTADNSKSQLESMDELEAKFTITGWEEDQRNFNIDNEDQLLTRAPSHDSFSVETVEPAMVKPEEQLVYKDKPEPESSDDIGLELTLGYNMHSLIEISDSET